jgi:pyruvate oxidase
MEKNMKWVKVANEGDLTSGRVKTVVADKQQVCLVHHKNEFSALGNRCPHQGGPLGEGQIEDGWDQFFKPVIIFKKNCSLIGWFA